jgi:preprotein translocase subunit SecE
LEIISPSRQTSRGGDVPLAEAMCSTISSKGSAAMAKINPGEFFRQVKAEANKVAWPSRQETVTTAIFVAIMMTILAGFFLGIDSIFGKIVQLLLSLAQ